MYYSTLISCDQSTVGTEAAVNDIRLACLNNLAALFIQCNEFEECIRLTQRAVEIDPNNVKALFRKAQAHDKLLDFDEALNTISRLLCIEPMNAQAKKFEADVTAKIRPVSVPAAAPSTANEEVPEAAVPVRNSDNDHIDAVQNVPVPSQSDISTSGGYSFMNPHWTPPPSASDPPPAPTATTATMTESGKSKLKNDLFASALQRRLQEERVSGGGGEGSAGEGDGRVQIGPRVEGSLKDLAQEENDVVEQMKTKAKTLRVPKHEAGKDRGGTSRTRSALRLPGQRVISDRAKDEWAALMSEEDDIKKKNAAKLSTLSGKEN